MGKGRKIRPSEDEIEDMWSIPNTMLMDRLTVPQACYNAAKHYEDWLIEKPGPTSEAMIDRMFDWNGTPNLRDDTAWCSLFANWVCAHVACTRSHSLVARDWMRVGEEIKHPLKGDVVVFWRGSPDSWRGHVGFLHDIDGDFVYTLGGNQSNRVKISAYPKHQLLGYRRLELI